MTKLSKIYSEAKNPFSALIRNWAEDKSIEIEEVELNSDAIFENCDSLVIFHENHNISKDLEDLRTQFDAKNKSIHKIDINGTMQVALSQFEIWMERNKLQCILILGDAELSNNPKIGTFFSSLDLA